MWVTASGLSRLQTTPGQAQHPDDVNVGLLFLTDSGIVRLKTTTTLQLSETIWTDMTERWWRILSCVCVCVWSECVKVTDQCFVLLFPPDFSRSLIRLADLKSVWQSVTTSARHSDVCTSLVYDQRCLQVYSATQYRNYHVDSFLFMFLSTSTASHFYLPGQTAALQSPTRNELQLNIFVPGALQRPSPKQC